MKLRRLLLSISTAVALSLSCYQCRAQDLTADSGFTTTRNLVDQLRRGQDSRLVLHLSADGFEVLDIKSAPIDAGAAHVKLREMEVPLPSIRFTESKEFAVYTVDSRTTIEAEVGSKPEKWIQRTATVTAAYPATAWNDFIEFCLRDGMTEFQLYQEGTSRFGEITFAATGPASISYVGGTINFSSAFYEDMRLSPDYPSQSGSNGFVVLVHDPHSDVSGRFRLVSGLSALFAANSGKSFEYLVEGAYPDPDGGRDLLSLRSRAISDGGLKKQLSKYPQAQQRAIVYSMLGRFLIDTPMAYQLLDPQSKAVHGIAIDDNRLLAEANVSRPSAAALDESFKQLWSAVTASTKNSADSKESEVKAGIFEIVYLTRALQQADLEDVSDQQLIDHFARLQQMFDLLDRLASELAKADPKLASASAVFHKQSDFYANEVTTYKNALKRNDMMLRFIESAARSSQARVPLAFIGSYHTRGLTRGLQAEHIGYVVIEPRRRAPSNHLEQDEKRFNEFLHDPNAYFRSQLSLNKGLCSLTPEQVQITHVPYSHSAALRFESHVGEINGAIDIGRISRGRLQEAVASNGWLDNADVVIGNRPSLESAAGNVSSGGHGGGTGNSSGGAVGEAGSSGGGGQKPPGIPAGAFAFFEEFGNRSRLVILDKESLRWEGDDRYRALGQAMFAFPFGDKKEIPVLHFARHAKGFSDGREYVSVYDGKSRRVYLVEGNVPQVASLLAFSAIRSRGSVNVHVQLGVLLKGGDNGSDPTGSANSRSGMGD